MAKRQKPGRRWPAEDKVRVVLAAAAAGDDGLGTLLRREGLHEADLERIRTEVTDAAIAGLQAKPRRNKKSPAEVELQAVRKELRRKEKALAETAALLVLRGKAEAFWAAEGDGTDGVNER